MIAEIIKPWVEEHSLWLGSLAGVSLVTFVFSLFLVPWLLTRLPADYFVREERRPLHKLLDRPLLRLALLVLKNTVGTLVFLAGIAMLLLPGQGLLTLFVALLLLDFPGKYRLERRVMQSERVFRIVNRLRARAGVALLQKKDANEGAAGYDSGPPIRS